MTRTDSVVLFSGNVPLFIQIKRGVGRGEGGRGGGYCIVLSTNNSDLSRV